MPDRTAAFLAYVIVTGRANLTPDEVTRLQKLAAQWLPVGSKVASTAVPILSAPPVLKPSGPAFTGTLAEWVDSDHVRVTTDAPVAGPAGPTTDVVVPIDQIKPA
jgi:hypothetical protein